MKSAVSVIESLIETIQTRKLWALASALLAIAGTYSANFMATAPQEYSEQLRFMLRINQSIEDGRRIESVFRVMNESQKGISAVLSYYQDNFGGKPIAKRHPASIIEGGMKGVIDTSNVLAMTIGTLNGLHLDSPELDSYRKEFIGALQGEQKMMGTLALFYVSQISKNEIEIRKASAAVAAMDIHSREVSSLLVALIQGFTDKAVASQKEFELTATEKIAARNRFDVRVWIFLCCVIYFLGYGIAVAIAYIRAVRQNDPSPIIAA